MKSTWSRFLLLALVAVFLGLAGCQKKQTEQQTSTTPAAEKATAAETAKVAKPDTTAPEPPPGYKSIHQIQLEEHKKQEEKKGQQ